MLGGGFWGFWLRSWGWVEVGEVCGGLLGKGVRWLFWEGYVLFFFVWFSSDFFWFRCWIFLNSVGFFESVFYSWVLLKVFCC